MNSENKQSLKVLNLLTMARRAGKLTLGFDPVKDAIFKGTAACVVIATDISEKTLKEAKFITERDDVPLLAAAVTMDELWGALGKRVGIIAVCDAGFAKKLSQIISENLL